MYAAHLTVKPRLLEPEYLVEIQAPKQKLGDMMVSDPLEHDTQAKKLVLDIRKRKGLKEKMMPLFEGLRVRGSTGLWPTFALNSESPTLPDHLGIKGKLSNQAQAQSEHQVLSAKDIISNVLHNDSSNRVRRIRDMKLASLVVDEFKTRETAYRNPADANAVSQMLYKGKQPVTIADRATEDTIYFVNSEHFLTHTNMDGMIFLENRQRQVVLQLMEM
ncbi:hypothetical protein SUGI_0337180 [Cryptomeria japonica]|nr:hypothetical protein SUGI_0337180 [Cryptomeria japonica]